MSEYSYFFDTTVIVHYFQKNQASKIYIDRLLSGDAKAATSTITELELWVGIKEDEVERHEALLSLLEIVDLDSHIARQAGKIFSQFRAQGVGIPDAIIAASAKFKEYKLITGNHKHFEPLHNHGIVECEFYLK